MIDGVLLRRAESEDAWAMGVIETACWRVGYAGVLSQRCQCPGASTALMMSLLCVCAHSRYADLILYTR